MGRSPHNSQDNAIDKSVFRSGEGDTDPNLLVHINCLGMSAVHRGPRGRLSSPHSCWVALLYFNRKWPIAVKAMLNEEIMATTMPT